MRAFRFLTGLLIFVAVIAQVSPHFTHAAPIDTGVNLSTSPLPINLSLNPGASVSTDIRIKNDNAKTEKIKVSLMKFSSYGEAGKPALKDREPGDDYFDWVHFSETQFNAEPKVWKTIKMTVTAPKTAAFGYYYAVVFTPDDTTKPAGQGNVLLGSTAVLVLVDVKSPNAKRSLELLSFSTPKQLYEFLPVNFSVRLHNNGNVHVQPHGSIFIKRGNKEVASIEFNSQQGNILPASNRIYETAWEDGFPVYVLKQDNGKTALDKQGNPIRELKWDFSKVPKLKFGHYTAHLLVVYDDGKRDVTLESTLDFWVIPWRVIGISLLILIFVVIGLWSTVKKIINKIRKKKNII